MPKTNSNDTLTKMLLTCAIIAGPLYIAIGLVQVLTRDGFDITRHALSLLSNGDWGWVQIMNFIITGLLLIAGAIGMRRALSAGRGKTWGPLLLGLYGLGLIGAGVFVADPALGFPAGTPADAQEISSTGMMHFMIGGIGFIGLVAACLVFARRFSSLNERGWKVFSILTGVLFLAAFMGIASGSASTVSGITISFALAVALSFCWISLLSAKLKKSIG